MKNKIDTSNWKEFSLENNSLFLIKRGKRLKSIDRQKGNIPYYSASNENNGLTDMISNPLFIEKNSIIFSTFGDAYYVEEEFTASDEISIFQHEKLNKYNALFICSVLMTLKPFFQFGNKAFYENFKDKKIKLPAIYDLKSKKYEPDWEYMENYMKNIEKKTQNKIDNLITIKEKKNKIDTANFKPFIVKNLFDIHPTSSYKMTNAQLLDGGENPVLANSSCNNGIGGYSSQKTTEKGNMITFSDTVDANTIFYQENDFIGYSHIQGLYETGEYKGCWTKYSLLYFAFIFKAKAKTKKFDYDNKFRRDIALNLDVLLPVDENNKIDFKYMENYMKDIEYKTKKKLQDQINT